MSPNELTEAHHIRSLGNLKLPHQHHRRHAQLELPDLEHGPLELRPTRIALASLSSSGAVSLLGVRTLTNRSPMAGRGRTRL